MARQDRLEIIPLGGLGEFGMNMMLYRCGEDCIVVDTGMMFPGSEHLGVDVVIPDLSFLDECGTIHGILLTHGHEDHIGALPYVLARHDVPVLAAPYTQGVVRGRLREHGLDRGADLRPLPEDGESITLGPFQIEVVPVAHSIPQAAMVVLQTPVGTLVHTADFKLDPDPPQGPGTDLARLAALGERGVLALLSDSTNAERPGTTPGERATGPALSSSIASADGRVFLTTFASNIPRMAQVAEIARRYGRKISVVGSSMKNHLEVAQRLGLLSFPAGARIDPDRGMELPPRQSLFLVTGSQGEPMSALARMAVDRHKEARIEDGDLVIHSARVIPGNEKSIDRLVNHVLRRGATVTTADDALIHVSGHPSGEELRTVLRLLRPRFFVPIHGEYRQMLAHARLAREVGLTNDRIVLAESGDVLVLDETSCRAAERIHVGQVFLDATQEEVDLEVLRDRRRIAGDGVVMAVVAIERGTGQLARPPELVARGFAPGQDEEFLLDEAGRVLRVALEEAGAEERTDEGLMKARIQTDLRRFFRRRFQRRPLIVPVIVEY